MQAMHGGTANNDQLDAQQMAALRRGGRLPHASVYPAAMRPPRDLLRRRPPLRRTRAALFAPGQQPNRPYNLPEIGKPLAYTATRAGIAERFADVAVHKTSEGARDLLTSSEQLLHDLALFIRNTAQQHDAQPLSLCQPVPGMGHIRSRVLLYAIPQIARCPRGQDCAA